MPATAAIGTSHPARIGPKTSAVPHVAAAAAPRSPVAASSASTAATRARTTADGPNGVAKATASWRIRESAVVTVRLTPNRAKDANPPTAAFAPMVTLKNRATSAANVAVSKASGTTSHGTTLNCARPRATASRRLCRAVRRRRSSGDREASTRRRTRS